LGEQTSFCYTRHFLSDSLGICRIFAGYLPSFGGIFATSRQEIGWGAGQMLVR
jgi:hypothetical protein